MNWEEAYWIDKNGPFLPPPHYKQIILSRRSKALKWGATWHSEKTERGGTKWKYMKITLGVFISAILQKQHQHQCYTYRKELRTKNTLVQRIRLRWCIQYRVISQAHAVSGMALFSTIDPPQCKKVTEMEPKRVPQPGIITYLRVFAVCRPHKLWTRLGVFFPATTVRPSGPVYAPHCCMLTHKCPCKHYWIWGCFPSDFVGFLCYKM